MRFFLPQGLWHHKDFLKFWTRETLSVFGSQITAVAFPMKSLTFLQTEIQL